MVAKEVKVLKDDRQYQQDARHWVNRQWNNKRNPLLVMPAGSGKSYTATLITKDRIQLGDRLLILTGVIDIFDQWVLEFAKNKIDYGYIANGEVYGQNKKVYICMWKTLNNMLSYLPEKFSRSFTKIITDEGHGASCTTLREIYDHFDNANKLLLTATPFRSDNQPLGEFCDVMYEPITQTEAIEKGYLCEPIIILPEEYKENIEKINNGEIELKDLIKSKTIIGDPYKMYKQVFNGQLVMVACDGVKHSRQVTKKFKSYGWVVEHIHGELDLEERRSIIKRARRGEINILVTYNVGSEGLDVVNIMGIMWLTFTNILKKWIQLNTRAARKDKNNPSKKNYVLIDMTGNYLVHKSPAIDREYSLHYGYDPILNDDDEKVQMQICPCGVANSPDNKTCWICGYNFETGLDANGQEVSKRKRKLPTMIDGKLVFLDEVSDDGNIGNNQNIYNYKNNRTDNTSNISNDNEQNKELTKAQKIDLISKNLTGVGRKGAFGKNVGWL